MGLMGCMGFMGLTGCMGLMGCMGLTGFMGLTGRTDNARFFKKTKNVNGNDRFFVFL